MSDGTFEKDSITKLSPEKTIQTLQIGGYVSVRESKLELFPGDILLKDCSDNYRVFESKEMWKNGPVVVVAIRRPGCFLCRHLAAHLTKFTEEIRVMPFKMTNVRAMELQWLQ